MFVLERSESVQKNPKNISVPRILYLLLLLFLFLHPYTLPAYNKVYNRDEAKMSTTYLNSYKVRLAQIC